MLEQWYFIRDRKKVGPVAWEQMQELSAAGRLQPTDMIMKAGAQKWHAAAAVAGLFSDRPAELLQAGPQSPTGRARPKPATTPPVQPAPQLPVAADQWFYIQNKTKLGPVAVAQLKELALAGQLLVNDMVLRAGQPRWQYAGDIADLFPAPADDEPEEEDDDQEEEVDVAWYLERAAEFQAQGNYARAIGEYEELVRLLADEPEGYQGLAWIWAACPEARFRNGTRAVEYAIRAVERAENSESTLEEMEADQTQIVVACQETLAAAYAEVGNFTAALAALDRALAGASKEAQAQLRYRRLLFQAKKPYRDGGRFLGDIRHEMKNSLL